MKSNASILACAVSIALALSACGSDKDTVASESDDMSASSSASSDAVTSSDMTTQSLPAPDANATASVPASSGAPTASSPMAGDSDLSFEVMDQNHDGYVTPNELNDNDPLKRDFPKVDANGDGKLSPDEVSAYRRALAASAAASTASGR